MYLDPWKEAYKADFNHDYELKFLGTRFIYEDLRNLVDFVDFLYMIIINFYKKMLGLLKNYVNV